MQKRFRIVPGGSGANISICGLGLYVLALSFLVGCHNPHVSESVSFRLISYNVEYGNRATPEQIGEALRATRPDVVTLNEVPGGDWVERVGVVLEMPYHYTGSVSSANHKDKYKAILSRTPLVETREQMIEGAGWNPASVVSAVTEIRGYPVKIYSLHIAGSSHISGADAANAPDPSRHHLGDLVDRVLAADPHGLVIVAGDFNDRLGEPQMQYAQDAGFRASWQDIGLDVTAASGLYTWDATGSRREGVIDHLLYRVAQPQRDAPGLVAVAGGIIMLAPPLADHHPIWAEFRITPPTPATER